MSQVVNFRDRVLARLEQRAITPETVADGLADAIQGIRRKSTFDVKEGVLTLIKVEELTTPKDLAVGAMIYDALHGGALGLSPKSIASGVHGPEHFAKFAPRVDRRIVSLPDYQSPAEASAEESDPLATTLQQVVSDASLDDDKDF